MPDDFPPFELPPEGRAADQFPYGMDTIVIPFTWSKPRRQGPDPMERVGQGYAESRRQLEQASKDARQTSTELALSALQSMRATSFGVHPRDAATAAAAAAGGDSPDSGASNGVTVPDQAATLASSPPPDIPPPTDAGTTTIADARAAGDAAAAGVSTPKDPTAPVPVVNDQGNPVLIPEGHYKGRQMLRPAGLDPHFFVDQGTADRSDYDARIKNPNPNPFGGDDAGLSFLSHELTQLSKFNHFGEWDAQRVGGKFHKEYVDYATVAIGLYAVSAGISRDEILRIQDLFAARESRFQAGTEMDKTYTHLPVTNVANTDLGFQLYQSGGIRAVVRS